MSFLLNSGQVIGSRYTILSYVGEGGMQQVFLADDNILSRNVALKVPKNNSAVKRFKRSAVVSAKVNHNNVAKTLDYIEEGDKGFLIEEFIEGKDFAKLLSEDIFFFGPQAVSRILHHLSKGLAASHHAGVVHRDLKPSNIMAVSGIEMHEVKITDFGIAKMAEEEMAEAAENNASLSASATALGAIPYMSPDMIVDPKKAGRATDVWSLGAIAFELISGHKPFGSGLSAIPKIASGTMPQLPAFCMSNLQFSPLVTEIEDIIHNCMVVDPAKRLTADQLTARCRQLCYPQEKFETGQVYSTKYSSWGFMSTSGKDAFFHRDSVYGSGMPQVGERFLFSRHYGGNADRAFPIVKLR